MHGRIHGFNVTVAHVWAEHERLLEKAGQRMPVEDSYIAATASRHGLTIRYRQRPGFPVGSAYGFSIPSKSCRQLTAGVKLGVRD